MENVSKLGPLWVAHLTKEVAHRRNRATESLLTINPEGDFAKQHRMLIEAANAMLAAAQLVTALRGAHGVIDTLMARMIDLDPSFLPSNSPVWPQVISIAEALAAIEA